MISWMDSIRNSYNCTWTRTKLVRMKLFITFWNSRIFSLLYGQSPITDKSDIVRLYWSNISRCMLSYHKNTTDYGTSTPGNFPSALSLFSHIRCTYNLPLNNGTRTIGRRTNDRTYTLIIMGINHDEGVM